MKTKQIICLAKFLCFSCIAGMASCLAGPHPLSDQFKVVDGLFRDGGVPNSCRVAISAISASVHVDPSPSNEIFGYHSSIEISINATLCYDQALEAIGLLRAMPLKRAPYAGSARWRWQIINIDSEKPALTVLIDAQNGWICMENQWFECPPALIEKLIRGFRRYYASVLDGVDALPQISRKSGQ